MGERRGECVEGREEIVWECVVKIDGEGEKYGERRGRKCGISRRGGDLSQIHVPMVHRPLYKTHHCEVVMVFGGVKSLCHAEG